MENDIDGALIDPLLQDLLADVNSDNDENLDLNTPTAQVEAMMENLVTCGI